MPESPKVVQRQAEFSEDRRYRYDLWRYFVGPPDSVCVFVMLNPSTADARRDDPTIRRCMGFAAQWGYDCVAVVNLYAYRTTSPASLWKVVDPVGPHNDPTIDEIVQQGDCVVLAWGSHGAKGGRGQRVEDRIRLLTDHVVTLGRTASGEPKHPLYLRSDAPREGGGRDA